ncbi:FAD/NAD-P-binding domain-containing protein [Auriscalpium vulgare]|uniref:FAD/NAD-P-binding domain-containing protein n=1 Tax=Auriscalpium vulgare TaxID=40419 RepID=A0ACB8S8W0_9AGAM|nr:FAD/NAD-P-binding domain-containing protein [Auriscalpium vulgare]
MRNLARFALSVLGYNHVDLYTGVSQTPFEVHAPSKRIAIIGAGTGGISMLKTIMGDLPEEAREGWEVVIYEQRNDIGGIWLPDPDPPYPPLLPETPLYERLMTNAPHPSMTIPHLPFRPGTALYPHHPYILQYHRDIVDRWDLSSYINLNQEVVETVWTGTPDEGRWFVKVRDRRLNKTLDSYFDHLVVASGHNHFPHQPHIQGCEQWIAGSPNRTVLHSVYYRRPEEYEGRNVIVVGAGASGRDLAQQIVGYANSTYVSIKSEMPDIPFPIIPGAGVKGPISRFTPHGVVFNDDSALTHIDCVVFATGYEYRFPFLTAGGHLEVVNQQHSEERLSTNLRRVYPIYEHVLSLDSSYPLGALYFVGLPTLVDHAIADTAQTLFAAYTLAYPDLLISRQEFLAELHKDETSQRADGHDPSYIGHRIIRPGGATAYQDMLVGYLQQRGLGGQAGIPRGRKFTEQWRDDSIKNRHILRKAWLRVEQGGQESERRWLKGVATEEDWADMMARLVHWEQEIEQAETEHS